jgi:hypothetical protein
LNWAKQAVSSLWSESEKDLSSFLQAQALNDLKIQLENTHNISPPLQFVLDEIQQAIREALGHPTLITKETLQIFKNRVISAEKDFAEIPAKAFEILLTPSEISFEGKALGDSLGSFSGALENVKHLYLH